MNTNKAKVTLLVIIMVTTLTVTLWHVLSYFRYPPGGTCKRALSVDELYCLALANSCAVRTGVDSEVFLAMMKIESGLKICIPNNRDYFGPLQINASYVKQRPMDREEYTDYVSDILRRNIAAAGMSRRSTSTIGGDTLYAIWFYPALLIKGRAPQKVVRRNKGLADARNAITIRSVSANYQSALSYVQQDILVNCTKVSLPVIPADEHIIESPGAVEPTNVNIYKYD